jgi:hypothetical protein
MPEIDSYLRSEVQHVKGLVVQLDRSLSVVGQQVAFVGNEQQETRSELAALRHDFQAYLRRFELAANLQRAETKVGVLEARVEHEFGHHKVVRRTAVGMLQAFDVGLVSEDTLRTVGDQLMIQTPRYWLAPVLVALAAWAGDDEELCNRAIETAMSRSPAKTSLFMALVLRRQDRQPNAVRWLKHYLDAQNPLTLGRDFAVILESISQGAFGPSGLDLVREFLDRWRQQLGNDEAVQNAQVLRWRAEVDSHVGPTNGARYPRLSSLSPQWLQMERVLGCAVAQRSILDKYASLMAAEITPNPRVEDAVDDILDRLVGEYDNDEMPLRRELALNLAIIEHDGDTDASQRVIDADSASLETTLDYLTIQTASALNPAAIGVSLSTQRIAVASCHEWFGRAHGSFTMDYRMAVPANVEVKFAGTHNTGAKVFALPEWIGSFLQPLEALEASLSQHWDRHSKAFIDAMGFNVGRNAILPAIGTAVAFILALACSGGNAVAGLLALLLVGGISAAVLYSRSQSALKYQNSAKAFLAQAKQESIGQLRGASAELTDWSSAFKEADASEAQVRALIADLATAGNTATPFERRGVVFNDSTGA